MRRSTDRLYPTTLGPREREALRIVQERPGITIAQLRDELGVGKARVWQIVSRLQYGVDCVVDQKRRTALAEAGAVRAAT